MKIAIVGGGIGGLATALAMTKAGLAVTVHERSEQLVDQGAGITLGPNATRVLYHLDIGPALEATSVVPPKMEYRHYSTGAVIKRVITGDFRAAYGSPYMRLHRWELQHAMMRLAEVAPGALRLGSGVDRLEHGGAGVTLRFTDGHTETADIVVAADGIRSAVREALFNPARPYSPASSPGAAWSPPPFCRSTYMNRPSPSGRGITSTGIWSGAASC
jgi:salicylate hydroxylase